MDRMVLLPAIMSLEAITGNAADPIIADFSDAQRGIREGMPVGAKVEITGSDMYNFMDKMVQCVCPRIREWNGLNAVGDDKGTLALTLDRNNVGYFPDIEAHFDSYPQLFDVDVFMHTSGESDWEAALCLSSLQLPIQPERDLTKLEFEKDPWKKYGRYVREETPVQEKDYRNKNKTEDV